MYWHRGVSCERRFLKPALLFLAGTDCYAPALGMLPPPVPCIPSLIVT